MQIIHSYYYSNYISTQQPFSPNKIGILLQRPTSHSNITSTDVFVLFGSEFIQIWENTQSHTAASAAPEDEMLHLPLEFRLLMNGLKQMGIDSLTGAKCFPTARERPGVQTWCFSTCRFSLRVAQRNVALQNGLLLIVLFLDSWGFILARPQHLSSSAPAYSFFNFSPTHLFHNNHYMFC